MAREVFKIEGLKALDAALGELAQEIGPRKGRAPLQQAFRDVAKPVVEHAQQLAPVDEDGKWVVVTKNRKGAWVQAKGFTPGVRKHIKGGQLKASIRVGSTLNRSQRATYRKQSDVEVYIGPSGLPSGIAQEFGTSTNPPQPFLRPAWEAGKTKLLEDFKDRLADRIDKAARRAAKKRGPGR